MPGAWLGQCVDSPPESVLSSKVASLDDPNAKCIINELGDFDLFVGDSGSSSSEHTSSSESSLDEDQDFDGDLFQAIEVHSSKDSDELSINTRVDSPLLTSIIEDVEDGTIVATPSHSRCALDKSAIEDGHDEDAGERVWALTAIQDQRKGDVEAEAASLRDNFEIQDGALSVSRLRVWTPPLEPSTTSYELSAVTQGNDVSEGLYGSSALTYNSGIPLLEGPRETKRALTTNTLRPMPVPQIQSVVGHRLPAVAHNSSVPKNLFSDMQLQLPRPFQPQLLTNGETETRKTSTLKPLS